LNIGGDRGEPRGNVIKSGAPKKELPIEIPAISLDELNKLTDNFGTNALIGEGSYGRVYYAKMKDDMEVAIKKLDTSSSPEPDSDFATQVGLFWFKILKFIEALFWVVNFHCLHHAVISCFKIEKWPFCGIAGILFRGK